MDGALLTALGLAAPAGLNAYLPLLVLAIGDRLSTTITLARPYDALSSTWGIALIVLLLTIELVVDKIPGVDHANDLLGSVLRPAAGAVLAMAATSDTDAVNPVVALVLGLLAAGAVHAAKATTRPVVTVATGGIGNPLISMVEDAVAGVTAVIALLLPWLAVALVVVLALAFLWARRRLRRVRPAILSRFTSTTLRQ